jgi:GNAT superfamily N-acetyltransferase
MNLPLSIAIDNNPDPSDIMAIRNGLDEYNLRFSEPGNHLTLTITLRTHDHRLVGGLLGDTFWRWLHIDILWIQDEYHGQGYGSRILELAEQEAIRHGCLRSCLETHDFQALPFYQRKGYAVFAQLPEFPPGHVKYFLSKDLA